MDYTDSRLKRYILSQKNKTELQLYAETGVKQKKKDAWMKFFSARGKQTLVASTKYDFQT